MKEIKLSPLSKVFLILIVLCAGVVIGILAKSYTTPKLWRVVKAQPEFSRVALENPARKNFVIWVSDISGECLASMPPDGGHGDFYYGKSYGASDCLWIQVNPVANIWPTAKPASFTR